jgi:hypothetical protein
MFGLILLVVVVAVIFSSFYYWARRHGLVAAQPAAEGQRDTRRVSLLTEAVAYVGAILLLAGGGAAIGQRWKDITGWGHVGVFAGVAAFFLLVGTIVRQVREPAVQRLVGVVWFLSVVGVAGAVGFATHDVYGNSGAVTVLAVGVAITAYSAALWLIWRRALQNVALFAGLVVIICGTIVTVAGEPAPSLAFAMALWGFGLAWAVLGWRRYAEPMWVATPLGVVLALTAPSFAVADHGWVYAIGIITAAAVMAISLPMQNTVLLALGTLAMFGYVTSAAVRYFHESLGVPAALAITGVLILGLAVVSARLMRAAHPPKPKEPEAEKQSHHPPKSEEPDVEKSSRQHLPKAS